MPKRDCRFVTTRPCKLVPEMLVQRDAESLQPHLLMYLLAGYDLLVNVGTFCHTSSMGDRRVTGLGSVYGPKSRRLIIHPMSGQPKAGEHGASNQCGQKVR